MADNRLPFQNPNTTDANLDTESLTVAGQTVHRERIQITGTDAVAIASVSATNIPGTAFGLGVRPVGDFNVLATTSITISNVLATVSLPTPSTSRLSVVNVEVNAATPNTVVWGTTGQTIRVFRAILVASASTVVQFRSGVAVNLSGPIALATNGSITLDDNGEPWYVTNANHGLILFSSAGVGLGGNIWYRAS